MIHLSTKQKGVLKGMVLGAFFAILFVVGGVLFQPFSSVKPVDALITSIFINTLFLIFSIARLAKHRFFTPEDMDGNGLTKGTDKVNLLQSLLQNTLEQLVIAIPVYLAWFILMPPQFCSVIMLCSIAFGMGRILFFIGYKNGAPSRALGFTLTFYPTVCMAITVAVYKIVNVFS